MKFLLSLLFVGLVVVSLVEDLKGENEMVVDLPSYDFSPGANTTTGPKTWELRDSDETGSGDEMGSGDEPGSGVEPVTPGPGNGTLSADQLKSKLKDQIKQNMDDLKKKNADQKAKDAGLKDNLKKQIADALAKKLNKMETTTASQPE